MLECLLFDLDNTLYPKSLGIFEMVVERIRNYMEVRMGLDKLLARELRQEYVQNYGSTLRGLMIHQNVDPEEYLEYVHDVPVEGKLLPNPDLAALLQSIPLPKAIFTSGHRPHALRVLRCLGLEGCFSRIFDITFTRYIPKPNREPYRYILEFLDLSGTNCLMVEDLPANLIPAKDMGMTTVLVDANSGGSPDGVDGFVDYRISEVLEIGKILRTLGVPLKA